MRERSMSTPLVELVPGVLTKLEHLNPGGSHKTRAARHIMREALASGAVTPGATTVIEKTGGNFGLGLIIECARHGLELELVIGLNFSAMKKRALQRMGARLVGEDMLNQGLTPREVLEWRLANQASLKRMYFYTDQFANPNSLLAHYNETATELIGQLDGMGVYRDTPLTFVGGAGTGASLAGIGRRLREEYLDVTVALVEPDGCDSLAGIHREHPLEGIAVGVTPPFLTANDVDFQATCKVEDMIAMQNRVAREHGLLLGNSAAAILSCAANYRRGAGRRVVITLSYDEGHWYL